MKSVTIVDYGLGNLHSVAKAFRHEGADVVISGDPDQIRSADRLVLPGVSAFPDGMDGLRKHNLVEALLEQVGAGRPFLGICLGMQLLLSASEEFGHHAGLAIIPGTVVLIPRAPGRKIPHIGWNRITPVGVGWAGTPLEPLEPGAMTYFVHSYTAVPECDEHRLADTNYAGHRISAAIRKDNVVGTQFHPEKSGAAGLAIIRRFVES